jgi:hypothetical protein
MAKSPADRYPTAQALADDLRRFLEDRPIQAKRPSLLEKAARWSRRRRRLVAAAVAALFVAVFGLSASTVLIACQKAETQKALDLLKIEEQKKDEALDRVREEEAQKDAALDAEDKARQKAEEAAWKARQVLNIFTQLSEEEIPDKPELRPVRRKMLETALGYYKDFIEQEGDNPAVQAELVASKLRIASILQEMGEKDDAQAIFEEVRSQLRGKAPPGMADFMALMGEPGLSVSGLLTQPAVRMDLKLSPEQVNRITALTAKRRDPSGMLRGEHDEAAKEKACFEVLKPEQAKRLQQVVWQQRGAYVFTDDEVARELDLSQNQREQIRRIMQPEEPRRTSSQHYVVTHTDDHGKVVSASDLLRDVLGVLTEDQKAKWKEMIGEPFQGEIHIRYPQVFVPLGGPRFPH